MDSDDLATELESRVVALFARLVRETPGELSLTAASVLARLADGPRRVTTLAADQSVAQPTMTVLVGRLEARGLVRREPDATDRRATSVVITVAGHEALARRRRARAESLSRRLAALDASDRAVIAAALPALDRMLDLP